MDLVSYAKDDLARPLLLEHAVTGDLAAGAVRVLADLSVANERVSTWCEQVNAVKHSEICAVPADRLSIEVGLLTPLPSLRPSIGPCPATRKVDKLSTIRLGSARYPVPARLIGTQVSVVVDGAWVLVLDIGTGEVHAEHAAAADGGIPDRGRADHRGNKPASVRYRRESSDTYPTRSRGRISVRATFPLVRPR